MIFYTHIPSDDIWLPYIVLYNKNVIYYPAKTSPRYVIILYNESSLRDITSHRYVIQWALVKWYIYRVLASWYNEPSLSDITIYRYVIQWDLVAWYNESSLRGKRTLVTWYNEPSLCYITSPRLPHSLRDKANPLFYDTTSPHYVIYKNLVTWYTKPSLRDKMVKVTCTFLMREK